MPLSFLSLFFFIFSLDFLSFSITSSSIALFERLFSNVGNLEVDDFVLKSSSFRDLPVLCSCADAEVDDGIITLLMNALTELIILSIDLIVRLY
jgi:hypothetical protein